MNENERKRKRYESNKRYDDAHMAYQTVKVRKNTLEEFKAVCKERGDKVNTVLREAIEEYIGKHGNKQSGLSSIAQTMQKPQREYEPNAWEAVIPAKYWGKFETLDEFTEYIHENGLEDELSKEMRCMT